MNITELTVHELQEKLKNNELSITEIVKAYTNRINEKEKGKKPCNVCCRGCQKEKIADVNKSMCGFVTAHTLFFL